MTVTKGLEHWGEKKGQWVIFSEQNKTAVNIRTKRTWNMFNGNRFRIDLIFRIDSPVMVIPTTMTNVEGALANM